MFKSAISRAYVKSEMTIDNVARILTRLLNRTACITHEPDTAYVGANMR